MRFKSQKSHFGKILRIPLIKENDPLALGIHPTPSVRHGHDVSRRWSGAGVSSHVAPRHSPASRPVLSAGSEVLAQGRGVRNASLCMRRNGFY